MDSAKHIQQIIKYISEKLDMIDASLTEKKMLRLTGARLNPD